jgi:ribosomal-protein-alanine N-acetyltransferase
MSSVLDDSLNVPIIETVRLLIRPFTMEDLRDVHELLDLEPAEMGESGWSLADRLDWLAWTSLSYGQYSGLYQPPYGDRAVILRQTGELVGVAGYVPLLMPVGQLPWFQAHGLSGKGYYPEFGLFYHVRAAFRGQGLATEAAGALAGYAFKRLHIARIVATTAYDNLASQSVMKKLGMVVDTNPLPDPPWLQVVGVLQNPELK